MKYNGVMDDDLHFHLFPFSLRDREKEWLNSHPLTSLHTCDDLVQNIFAKFFPSAKIGQVRMEINSFMQHKGETMVEA